MKTVNQTYEQTLEIMKSKFISILMPLNNPDDFKETLKILQKEHRKARHICFAYNVGPTAFKNSTLLKKINNNDFVGAADEFDRWIYDNKVISKGLINRRKDEKKLFLTPDE